MYIGSLCVDLFLPGVTSLKNKRRIIQSLKTKLKNKYNLSIGEVDNQDMWQKATIGIAIVNHKYSNVNNILQNIFNYIDQVREIEISDHEICIY